MHSFRNRLYGTIDMYHKTLTFKLLERLRQRVDVEGGFSIAQRLRQAQPDPKIKSNSLLLSLAFHFRFIIACSTFLHEE